VKFSLSLIKQCAMKMYTFLTSALNAGESLASSPGHYSPVNGVPSTHWVGGWMGPELGYDLLFHLLHFFTYII